MQDEKGRKKVLDIYKKYPNQIVTEMALSDKNLVGLLKCLCWSTVRNSVAMWSIYSSGNKSIMIKTTKEKLANLSNGPKKFVKVCPVEYISELSLEDEIRRCIEKNRIFKLFEVFITKRDAFKHENEYRAFIGSEQNRTFVCGGQNSNVTNTHKEAININIPNISTFIDEVLIHPLASEWYVKIVKKFCEGKLTCSIQKSCLYDFTI